ncbi:MAG: hypothetical protein IJR88_00750 [Clostridia bacterium]|nr:hypothetical protein [Clostridia bacterium]
MVKEEREKICGETLFLKKRVSPHPFRKNEQAKMLKSFLPIIAFGLPQRTSDLKMESNPFRFTQFFAFDFWRSPDKNLLNEIPPHSGWYFIFGQALSATGNTHVRF